MDQMPIIKIEIDGMRQSIAHALSTYHQDIEGYVDKNLKQVVETFDYETLIRQVARESITKAVTQAIQSYFSYGEGYKEIEETITAVLKKHIWTKTK